MAPAEYIVEARLELGLGRLLSADGGEDCIGTAEYNHTISPPGLERPRNCTVPALPVGTPFAHILYRKLSNDGLLIGNTYQWMGRGLAK